MIDQDITIELSDTLEHLNFVLSADFINKWKAKYSEKFLRSFQLKILEQLTLSKPIKKTTLTNYMVKRCRYSLFQVENFYEAIDISLMYPVVLDK